MGINHSSSSFSDAEHVMKPNKMKAKKGFQLQAKPNSLTNLIVGRDWQQVLIRISTHPHEVMQTVVVRLYDVNRKVLPLHLACAMQPPLKVVNALLIADEGLLSILTPTKNCQKKKKTRPGTGTRGTLSPIHSPQPSSNSRQLISEESVSSTCDDDKYTLSTCTTMSLSSTTFDSKLSHGTSTDFMYNENDALQLTSSGLVKRYSPTSSCGSSITEMDSSVSFCSDKENITPDFTDGDAFLPLHVSCLFRASEEVIQSLIDVSPDSVKKRNSWGMLPIHIVCANVYYDPPKFTPSKERDSFGIDGNLVSLYEHVRSLDEWQTSKVVESLISAFPESARLPTSNSDWSSPIDLIKNNITNTSEKEKILNILGYRTNSNGSSSSLPHDLNDMGSSSGLSVFTESEHQLYSLIKDRNWDDIIPHVSNFPEEASYWVQEEEMMSTPHPSLPIHIACRSRAPREVIQAILTAFPKGAMAKDSGDWLPLHQACEMPLEPDIISDLLSANPNAISHQDEFGRLPLHIACANGASPEGIGILLDAFPESNAIKDYNGHTALTYLDSNLLSQQNESFKVRRNLEGCELERKIIF